LAAFPREWIGSPLKYLPPPKTTPHTHDLLLTL
jgi:hypothetical protein